MESLYFGKAHCMLLKRTVSALIGTKMVISALISLSTIGFGDMVPMVEPPLMYADAVRNESGMFEQISTLIFYPKIFRMLQCSGRSSTRYTNKH